MHAPNGAQCTLQSFAIYLAAGVLRETPASAPMIEDRPKPCGRVPAATPAAGWCSGLDFKGTRQNLKDDQRFDGYITTPTEDAFPGT